MLSLTWRPQEDAHGCGLAVLAMITGTPYERVKVEIESQDGHGHNGNWNERGLTHISLDRYLTRRGFYRQRRYKHETELGAWPPEPWAPVHYASVKQPSGNGHFVVMDSEGNVLDPMREGLFKLTDWPEVNNVCGLVVAFVRRELQQRTASAEQSFRAFGGRLV